MKNLFTILFVTVAFSLINPQQFHSLDGIEDNQGNTLLQYRLGEGYFFYNPVYELNTISLSEELLIQAFYSNFPGGELAKAVWDFEFFPGDAGNFMNVGYEINPDNHAYIARNDSIVFGGFDGYWKVDISKQNPLKVFVFGGAGEIRSWDGGYTFPIDSIPYVTNFIPIALADFDDEVMFGFDEDLNFCRNGGVVDTSLVIFDEYSKLLYDINKFHVYRVNKTYGGYSLNVSNNKGNAFTWTKTYQSENPIFITIDLTQSGIIYLADGRRIYKSINNGYTFSEYNSLPSKIIGIYKKPNSEILYTASKKHIYRITPDSIEIIKSLPIPEGEYGWFPLAVGNTWIYDSYSLEGISRQFTCTKYMKVVNDTLIENKNYLVIENEFTLVAVFSEQMFLRIDSATGFIYRYWTELDSEYIFHDLYAEEGDIIYNPFNPNEPFYYLQYEHPTNYLGLYTYERWYLEYGLCTCHHNLIKGFGLASTYFLEVYGEENILKGCIIDGVLFGDTTFVNVENEINQIPTEYKLEQNYPNPFNPSTIIRYQLLKAGNVILKVFDVLGREVATLVDEYRNAGSYNLEFRMNNLELSSGIYYYQLKAGDYIETKKMMVVK